ncbi:hypothetical protein [Nonomuraea cavernae]|nr:hypothetical protein [Nonomuraea cavernae]MCA2187963.1 hypothetical protein [Nonomuraea cavernae]
MTEVIMFDLYGVIARTQTDDAKHRLVDLAGVPGDSFWQAYWLCRPAYDAGQDGVACWATVAERLGISFPDVPALMQADLDSWCRVDDEMVSLVCELADQGRTLGLLFVDDNEANVLAAREAGMAAELFTSPAQVRAPALRD